MSHQESADHRAAYEQGLQYLAYNEPATAAEQLGQAVLLATPPAAEELQAARAEYSEQSPSPLSPYITDGTSSNVVLAQSQTANAQVRYVQAAEAEDTEMLISAFQQNNDAERTIPSYSWNRSSKAMFT